MRLSRAIGGMRPGAPASTELCIEESVGNARAADWHTNASTATILSSSIGSKMRFESTSSLNVRGYSLKVAATQASPPG
jgi:hypothetical protein